MIESIGIMIGGANEFDFIEVEEFYQGVSVFTQFSGEQMNNIEYALKQ